MRDWTENQIALVLIRHGETKSNREQRYLGKTEEPLSKEGKDRLMEYKRQNCYPDVDYLFTSPMKRCIETAEILYEGMEYLVIPEWEEMDFGAFEGKNYQELRYDRRYQAWLDSNGTIPFPNGESREAFLSRCRTGFLKMTECIVRMEAEERKGKRIGMIVHGGTIMALLSQYAGGEYFDYQAANGSGYSCMLQGAGDNRKLTELKKLHGKAG